MELWMTGLRSVYMVSQLHVERGSRVYQNKLVF